MPGAAVAGAPGRPAAVAAPPRPGAAGLLETIAVRGGEPVDADAHLARLRGERARALRDRAARSRSRRRRPTGACACCWRPAARSPSRRTPEPAAATEVVLEPRALAGGLGPHKWLDRPQDPAWLAVDLDGAVLEAAWANVWIEAADGALLTPPADGRILPGITRARLLAAPHLRAREAPLTLARSRPRPGDRPDLLDPPRDARRSSAESPAARAPSSSPPRLREDPAISMKTRSYIR